MQESNREWPKILEFRTERAQLEVQVKCQKKRPLGSAGVPPNAAYFFQKAAIVLIQTIWRPIGTR
jgi:hypothetical protein